MARTRLLYIERKSDGFVSIERVFETVANALPQQNFEVSFTKLRHGNGLFGILRNLLEFRPVNADVYHVTGQINYLVLILPRNRTVLTFHDTGIMDRRRGLRRWLLRKLLFDWPLARLRYVTAISDKTKRDLVELTHCDPDSIVVIENPLQATYHRPGTAREIRSCPVILQIGTAPHKNLVNLARACAGLNVELRIIGRPDDDALHTLLEHDVKFSHVTDLSDEEVRQEYENADILGFCSTFEGFGLPIIEAQAMRRPVITSDLSPLREVAGDGGALLVDPYDPASIRDAIVKLTTDAELVGTLVSCGSENVKRFTPEQIALEYAALYDRVRSDAKN